MAWILSSCRLGARYPVSFVSLFLLFRKPLTVLLSTPVLNDVTHSHRCEFRMVVSVCSSLRPRTVKQGSTGPRRIAHLRSFARHTAIPFDSFRPDILHPHVLRFLSTSDTFVWSCPWWCRIQGFRPLGSRAPSFASSTVSFRFVRVSSRTVTGTSSSWRMSAAYVQASSLVDMATALSRKGGGARTYRMNVVVGHLLLSFLWVGFGIEREPRRVRLDGEPGVWVRPTRVCKEEPPPPLFHGGGVKGRCLPSIPSRRKIQRVAAEGRKEGRDPTPTQCMTTVPAMPWRSEIRWNGCGYGPQPNRWKRRGVERMPDVEGETGEHAHTHKPVQDASLRPDRSNQSNREGRHVAGTQQVMKNNRICIPYQLGS